MVLDPGTTYLTISCSPSDGGTLIAESVNDGSTWTPTSNSEVITDPTEILSNLMVDENNITVDSGTVSGDVIYTATPSEGYAFSHWLYNGVILSNGSTPQTTGNQVITAVFAVDSFTVLIVSNDASKGTVSPMRVNNVPNGTVIAVNGNTLDINGTTVTATPTSGHSFMGWANVDGEVTADRMILATFASSKTVTLENGHDYLLMSNGDVSVVSYANNVITFTHESPVDIIDLGKKGRTDGAHVTCCIDSGVYPVTDLIE